MGNDRQKDFFESGWKKNSQHGLNSVLMEHHNQHLGRNSKMDVIVLNISDDTLM